MADITKGEVLTYLEKASMMEISELIKEIEEKFDIKAAPQVAVPRLPQRARRRKKSEALKRQSLALLLKTWGQTKFKSLKPSEKLPAWDLKSPKILLKALQRL